MDLRLKGQQVLVTGGSKGIGAACAKVFLQEGCSVTIVSRDAEKLGATRAELASFGKIAAFPADLSQSAERERVAEVGAAHVKSTLNHLGISFLIGFVGTQINAGTKSACTIRRSSYTPLYLYAVE